MLKRTTQAEPSFYNELTAEEQRDALKIAENCWRDFGSLIKPVVSAFYRKREMGDHQIYIYGGNFLEIVPVGEPNKLIVFPLEYVEAFRAVGDTFQLSITIRMLLEERRVHWNHQTKCLGTPSGKGFRFITSPQLGNYVLEPIKEET